MTDFSTINLDTVSRWQYTTGIFKHVVENKEETDNHAWLTAATSSLIVCFRKRRFVSATQMLPK